MMKKTHFRSGSGEVWNETVMNLAKKIEQKPVNENGGTQIVDDKPDINRRGSL